MSNLFDACDCSSNGLPLYIPARCTGSCGGDLSGNIQATEKIIQNQVRVPESQYIDVLGAVTIANDYLDSSANTTPRVGSMVWGNRFSLRNQSDRRLPSRTVSGLAVPQIQGTTNYVNVPTRGNSTRSTITANKPGAMTPGGYGVDVKHGSYARYLGKLKGRTMAVGGDGGPHAVPKAGSKEALTVSSTMNNKSYRFTLVNTRSCLLCNGLTIPLS
jgi:hypothetical protein